MKPRIAPKFRRRPQNHHMFKFLRRQSRTGGLIAHLGLVDWWETELNAEERSTILTRYQPMGSDGTSIIVGEVAYSSQSPLHFLWGLAGWFKRPEDLQIAQKIFAKGSTLLTKSSALDVHFFHQARIEFFYRLRELHPEAKALAEQACRDQIAVAPMAALAFRTQHEEELPSHKGFWQLAVLLEKEGRISEAIELCKQAQAGGWPGDWESRSEKLAKKLNKSNTKT